jgi:glycosyltransferase involved in cell wall biosynthesis
MKPYRIGVDGSLACTKRPTGVEHYARSMLNEMLRLDQKDAQFYVYLSPFADTGAPIPETAVARYRPDVNTLIKKPWLVAQTWRDRLDVLYSFGHILPPGCRGKKVLTVYDTAFDRYPDTYPPGAPETARTELKATLPGAVRVQVPSQATRHAVNEDYGIPADRVDVFLGGYRDSFKPGPSGGLPEDLQAKLDAAGVESPFILCVGRLDRRKNLERVIDAYRFVLKRGVKVGGLVIAGPDDSGSEEVRLRLASGRLENERIATTGYVGDRELAPLYRTAAVMVYPSLAEGFGLPVLEAMASGTPTITSNVSSMPEVAGDAGLVVDPTSTEAIAEAIEAVLTQPDLSARLREAGPARAAGFTWKRSGELLLEGILKAAAS